MSSANNRQTKRFKKTPKIGTHSGAFHCDELLACFMLKQLPEYKSADIIRTRDEDVLAECDIVVDVGGVYDPEIHRYDHHQRDFNHTMHSLNRERPWTTKLSSAGLVYHHFGHRVIGKIVDRRHTDSTIHLLFDKIYRNFVEEVDAVDNGIHQCCAAQRYSVTTTLSSRVKNFAPVWNQHAQTTDAQMNKQFDKAMAYVGNEFTERVQFYFTVWWPARELVEKAHSNRFQVDNGGEIITLDHGGCPWREHLLDLEDETGSRPLVKFVIYEAGSDSWRVQCVPVSSFKSRLPLPAKWRGLKDADLCRVARIEDCIFVHANGFIGGNRTYEGALQMARAALKSRGFFYF